MEDIFTTIFNALKALGWLKQISSDEGQLESIDEQGNPKPVSLLPSVLIDMQSISWEAGDVLTQDGSAIIITRFAYRKTADQNSMSSLTLFNSAITNLKKRSDIEKAITNATPASSHGKIMRVSTQRENRSDGIIVIRTTWICPVTESMA